MVDEVAPRVPTLERTICFDTDDWAELLAAGANVSAEQLAVRAASLQPNDAINIQYTSGTTGFPKGATLSHNNILNNASFLGSQCECPHGQRIRSFDARRDDAPIYATPISRQQSLRAYSDTVDSFSACRL